MTEYFIALILTIVIETTVAAIMGYRSRRMLTAVIIVSLMTHPALHYLLWLNTEYRIVAQWPALFVLEGVVVIVEWLLLCFVERELRFRLLLLSFAMNLASFGIGLIWVIMTPPVKFPGSEPWPFP